MPSSVLFPCYPLPSSATHYNPHRIWPRIWEPGDLFLGQKQPASIRTAISELSYCHRGFASSAIVDGRPHRYERMDFHMIPVWFIWFAYDFLMILLWFAYDSLMTPVWIPAWPAWLEVYYFRIRSLQEFGRRVSASAWWLLITRNDMESYFLIKMFVKGRFSPRIAKSFRNIHREPLSFLPFYASRKFPHQSSWRRRLRMFFRTCSEEHFLWTSSPILRCYSAIPSCNATQITNAFHSCNALLDFERLWTSGLWESSPGYACSEHSPRTRGIPCRPESTPRTVFRPSFRLTSRLIDSYQ